MEAGHQLDDRYRSTGKQGPQLDKVGQIDSKRYGLAKKFIQFFCIRCYGKVSTNFLANPILHTLLLSKKGFLKEKVLLDQCLVTKHTLYEGSNTI